MTLAFLPAALFLVLWLVAFGLAVRRFTFRWRDAPSFLIGLGVPPILWFLDAVRSDLSDGGSFEDTLLWSLCWLLGPVSVRGCPYPPVTVWMSVGFVSFTIGTIAWAIAGLSELRTRRRAS